MRTQSTIDLRGILFPKVCCAPGALGFFGEGYWFHDYARYLGLNWKNTGFAAKTMTLEPRPGNMPLGGNFKVTPKQLVPKCIVVKPRSGHVLNAVNLSNPGAYFLLETGKWQQRTEPFFLSFMAVSETKEQRLEEFRMFIRMFERYLPYFRAVPGLQLNFGCPNTEHGHDDLLGEIYAAGRVIDQLRIPIIVNLPVTAPVELILKISEEPIFDAVWLANTVPWGTPGIDWKAIFGSEESPLIKRGFKQLGGLSGPTCLKFTLQRLRELRMAGCRLPIYAGNGVQSPHDAENLLRQGTPGCVGIALGSIAIVRPWKMRATIHAANTYPYVK